MTNFIFKSSVRTTDLQKINQKLLIIQSELRHQRSDHVIMLNLLSKLTINDHLQKQVDDYYGSDVLGQVVDENGSGKDSN